MDNQTLADLMREVGLTPAWQAHANTRPARPLPRQMRPLPQRMADPNAGVRRQAQQQFQAERQFRQNVFVDTHTRDLGDHDRYLRETTGQTPLMRAGMEMLEMTGAPALSRSMDAAAVGDWPRAAEQGAWGALGIGSMLPLTRAMPRNKPALPRVQPELPQMPNPPPRLPGRASDGSVLPVRPPEPIRQSMVGGSDDLMEAAGLPRSAPDAGDAGARSAGLLDGLSDNDPIAKHLGMRATDVVALLQRYGAGGTITRSQNNTLRRLREFSQGRELNSPIQRYYQSNVYRQPGAEIEILEDATPPSLRGQRRDGFVVRRLDGEARGYDIEAPGGGVITTRFEPSSRGRVEIDFDRIGGPATLGAGDARLLLRRVVDAVRVDARAFPNSEYVFVSASPSHQRVYRAMLREFGLDPETPSFRASQALAPASPDGGNPGAGSFDTGRVVYRGLNRPYNAADGGYYQSFTSSLDDAREYGSQVMAAHIRPGRNLAIDGGGNNFNALSVEQLPADVRARLHPSVGASATTDQIAHAAREAGYDSVTVRNVHDNRWGERPIAGAQPRTIDFVFNTENIRPLDAVPPQAAEAARTAEKVKLTAADRALLDELGASDAPNAGNAPGLRQARPPPIFPPQRPKR